MNLLLGPRSSLGKKYVVAVTGVLLIGFVLVHMAGNLLVFAGPDALNTYASTLKARAGLLWTARIGLLAVFLVHLTISLWLQVDNYKARPQRYTHEGTLQASWASRHMLLTGLLLLAFILYHLAHFTLGMITRADAQYATTGAVLPLDHKSYMDLTEVRQPDGKVYYPAPEYNYRQIDPRQIDARHDVYSMVLSGFRNPWITGSYLLAMLFLGLHLWHGGSSWLQSLGWTGNRPRGWVGLIGPVLAVVVVAGNCAIPLAVWLGIVK